MEELGATKLGSHSNKLIINWIYMDSINMSVLVPLSLHLSPPIPNLSSLSEWFCQMMYCTIRQPKRGTTLHSETEGALEQVWEAV